MLCLRNFPGPKNSMDKKRGYQDFPSQSYCLTRPKSSLGEPSVFHYFRVSEIFMLQRVVTIFGRFLLSHSTEKIRREPFCAVLQNISGDEKDYG